MSEDNVKMSLRVVDAWNRRDPDAVVALWDPDGVWSPGLERIAEGRRTYRGHAGIRQSFQDLAEFAAENDPE
jgi:ketosteroid isomerase-like protein